MNRYYGILGISPAVTALGERILTELEGRFREIDDTAEFCQLKVLHAMQSERVSEACLHPSTGYGYNDIGRDALERVYAHIFRTEDALVRPLLACGTHALAVALSGNLRPGDVLLSPVGKPYDTLEEVIGIRPSRGSLAEYGVRYEQVDLLPDGTIDFEGVKRAAAKGVRMATIQRSRGYLTRRTFSVEEIGRLIACIREADPSVVCMVDNCYGEFTEEQEPTEVGADLAVGSLIKNPGGGLAPVGGYIVGRKEYVENAAYRLTAPGLGKEVGASLGTNPAMFQGLFLAPTVTAAALKGAVFAAAMLKACGFSVFPEASEKRHDIIQAATLGSPEAVIAFCRGIQAAAPVDSFVRPEPWAMPGYDSEVIMAAGSFIQGSSIELSADAPIREPYTVFFQGGLTWPHVKFGILKAIQTMADEGVVRIEE